ncbi:M48 family peptidase [Anabaena sp. YBS01]|nr:M48 family peptidase [Anabaena sp. YBS01]
MIIIYKNFERSAYYYGYFSVQTLPVKLSQEKQTWGSCSKDGVIRMNVLNTSALLVNAGKEKL